MLLTEKPQLNIICGELNIDFNFNFRVIENLYFALKEEFICKKLSIESITPLELLEKLDNKFDEGYFILLLHSSSNGKYDIDTIYEELKKLDLTEKQSIYHMFKSIILQSLIYIESKTEEYKNEIKKEQRNSKEIFEDWFNYYYTMSIDKLKVKMDEFYNSTPAQLKERINRVNIDKKNTYILSYVEVMKATSRAEENKVEEVDNAFDFFKKI